MILALKSLLLSQLFLSGHPILPGLKPPVFNQPLTPEIPALQLLDPPQGSAAGPASQGAFDMQIGSELVNEGSRLWSALAETSLATASRFSRLVSNSVLCRTRS